MGCGLGARLLGALSLWLSAGGLTVGRLAFLAGFSGPNPGDLPFPLVHLNSQALPTGGLGPKGEVVGIATTGTGGAEWRVGEPKSSMLGERSRQRWELGAGEASKCPVSLIFLY